MKNFVVEPELLKKYGDRIKNISDNALSQTITSLDSVENGISTVLPDLMHTMDLLIKRIKKNKTVIDGLGQAAIEIGLLYRIIEDSIANYTMDSGNDGARNLNLYGGGGASFADSRDVSIWDEIKQVADILGMSFTEAIHLYGDLIQIIGAGIWEGATGWLDGYDWEAWIYQYVPNHVDDKTLLAIFTLLSMRGMSSEVSRQHLEANIDAWEDYLSAHGDDYYIEHQGDMGALFYGNHNADYNACEVIAVYNALLDLNGGESPVSFPELLHTFEQDGICLNGDWGTSPTALYLYLEANGYKTKMLAGGQIKKSKLDSMQDKYDTYILTAYNNGDNLSDAVHTVSITTETIDGKEQYVIHNASGTTTFDSLAEAVEGYHDGKGESISVIGVR